MVEKCREFRLNRSGRLSEDTDIFMKVEAEIMNQTYKFFDSDDQYSEINGPRSSDINMTRPAALHNSSSVESSPGAKGSRLNRQSGETASLTDNVMDKPKRPRALSSYNGSSGNSSPGAKGPRINRVSRETASLANHDMDKPRRSILKTENTNKSGKNSPNGRRNFVRENIQNVNTPGGPKKVFPKTPIPNARPYQSSPSPIYDMKLMARDADNRMVKNFGNLRRINKSVRNIEADLEAIGNL